MKDPSRNKNNLEEQKNKTELKESIEDIFLSLSNDRGSSYAFNLANNLNNKPNKINLFQISLIKAPFLHTPKESYLLQEWIT